jgi:hypothetical protein
VFVTRLGTPMNQPSTLSSLTGRSSESPSLYLEPGVRPSRALDEAFDRALDRIRRTVGLERIAR